MATIYGTFTYFNGVYNDDYDDTLFGTAEGDTIYGLGGDDVINLEGRYLGRGVDEAYGGDGNDKIFGSSSRDILDGGEGLDQLYGGDGNDDIYGGEDTDWLSGDGDNDHLFGEDGCDQLYGGDGIDELYGGESSDWLDGGTGWDTLVGGAGADFLTGGSGYDDFQFVIENNWFNPDSAAFNPDTIMDYTTTEDHIVLVGSDLDPILKNYEEDTIGIGAGYDAAKTHAMSLLDGDKTYAFVTDQVDGYLFIEPWGGQLPAIETVGIKLVGLTSVADFEWYDVMSI
jgi:Ca2+-binding RTX toxin-like protein